MIFIYEDSLQNMPVTYNLELTLVDNEKERAQNIEKLFKMLDRLKEVEIGRTTVEKEFMQVREELAEEYLYPKFGGKNEFQKALEKDMNK